MTCDSFFGSIFIQDTLLRFTHFKSLRCNYSGTGHENGIKGLYLIFTITTKKTLAFELLRAASSLKQTLGFCESLKISRAILAQFSAYLWGGFKLIIVVDFPSLDINFEPKAEIFT